MRPRLASSKEPAGCSTVQYSPVYLVNRVSKPYKDPPALAYFSLSSERCDVVMQPHHRREGLFGRHRRPAPGALRRGPGGGAEAVRGPQACLGDATGRLRALNGLYFHPFSVLATALDVSITLGWSAGATYAPPPTTTAYTATVCLNLSCFPIDTGKDVRMRLVLVFM